MKGNKVVPVESSDDVSSSKDGQLRRPSSDSANQREYRRSRSLPAPPQPSPFAPFSKDGFNVPMAVVLKRNSTMGSDPAHAKSKSWNEGMFQSESGTAATGTSGSWGVGAWGGDAGADGELLLGDVMQYHHEVHRDGTKLKGHPLHPGRGQQHGDSERGNGKVACKCFG